jgi:hypothetical protein
VAQNKSKDFFDHTRSSPPSQLLRQAVRSVRSKTSALDLGSGGLKDSRFLLECGFEKVVALDVVLVAEAVAAGFPRDRFTYLKSSFETFDFPVAAFDLINAQFSPRMSQWTICEEDRFRFTSHPWSGEFRWFRSPNVVCLERYQRRKAREPAKHQGPS